MSDSETNLRIMARGLRFPEGPIAMADGSVIEPDDFINQIEVANGSSELEVRCAALCKALHSFTCGTQTAV